ncbi:PP2C family protein-serine/threonine phosphatase [Chromobacterium sp. Beijing]|uniref:PP2C family protein-serine/threonine phosphatase n=1 Tax=Chromobacterium sp. Beijing TaxID=2735795 RepID=UPI001F2246E8|nr:PP2C family protein-serine/threonine phosphatase [Chromobacterium sp. Beijing]UJB33605.1 serine/threonine-protein phosphatase [Chromobacterium sp. Beijing]
MNFDLLAAKIQVFLRIAEMQEQINQDAIRLERYYQANEEEQRLTLELIKRLNEQYTSPQSHIWQHLSPATNFNGDLICICPSPSGQEHIMLADCTGHGLAAAISALPVVDCFYEMTRNGSSLSDIAAGINKKIYKLLPRSRFVAAALISIDHKAGTISVWNGGIPCVLLFSALGKLAVILKSQHPPLGVLSESDFDNTLQTLKFYSHDTLVVSSDGITESKSRQGGMFGVEGIINAVKNTGGKVVGTHILEAVSKHLEGDPISDDVSLLVVDCIQRHENS